MSSHNISNVHSLKYLFEYTNYTIETKTHVTMNQTYLEPS